MNQNPPAWRFHGPALVGFLLLTVLFTFPAAIRLGSHAMGTVDVFAFVWEFWWFHHAVFVLHQSPLTTDLLFFPASVMPLIWSTPMVLVPGMALTGLVGPVVAYNLMMLGGLALAGVGGYLLAWHLVRRRLPAFLAGAIFAFGPTHMAHVEMGQIGLASVQWVPFFALAALRLYERPTWGRAGFFALALALVMATDLYVAVYFLGLFGLAFAGYHLAVDRAGFCRPAFLGRAAAATVAAAIAVFPFYLPTLLVLKDAATTAVIAESVHRFGQDLVQLLLPPPKHRLLGWLASPWQGAVTNSENWGYIGWGAIALAGVALLRARSRQMGFWALFSGLGVLLAMGTTLHVAGPTPLPLPYWLASETPLLENFRAPGRFMIFAGLGLGMLAAYAASWLVATGRRKWLLALSGLLLLEYYSFAPFPTRTAQIPDYYRALAADPSAGAVLAIPNGTPDWGEIDHQWMYFQTAHRRPLVYAHTHRVPSGMLDWVKTTPVVKDLTNMAATNGTLQIAEADRAGARERLAAEGISHVALHAVPGLLEGDRFSALKDDLTALLGVPEHEEPGMAVYRIGHGPQLPASP
ncbi:MAG: hypothetical protein ACLGIN_10720, partial [Candidatus Sericytochromatia bacterium]